ncbi:MAG: LysR family transcriptional regulator [Sporolactobacillus sp.]
MELLQLKYFQTVAHLEHMTRAAKILSIAQPSLSQTIRRLEEEIGVPLFERQGRHIRLNRYGKIFLDKTEAAFSLLQEARQQVNDLANTKEDAISIAVMRTPLVPDLLSGFREAHPSARFRVKLISRQLIDQQLESGEVDLCISPYPHAATHLFTRVLLLNDEIFLVVPKTHRLAGRASVDLREVAHEPFVLKADGAFRETTDSYCRMAGFQPDVAFEVDDPLSIRGLVSEGLGIAFFSSLALHAIQDQSLVPLKITRPHCYRTITLSWNIDHYHSPIVTAFYRYVMNYFAELEQKLK